MAATPGDVCAGHDAHAIACVKCMHTNFQRELLFEKELSPSDLTKLYLPVSYVSKICSEPTPIELPMLFNDPAMNPRPMFLKRTTRRRWYLTEDGAHLFVTAS
ncbi:hypothetical protein SLA2020_335360 [Shorea laevis]